MYEMLSTGGCSEIWRGSCQSELAHRGTMNLIQSFWTSHSCLYPESLHFYSASTGALVAGSWTHFEYWGFKQRVYTHGGLNKQLGGNTKTYQSCPTLLENFVEINAFWDPTSFLSWGFASGRAEFRSDIKSPNPVDAAQWQNMGKCKY